MDPASGNGTHKPSMESAAEHNSNNINTMNKHQDEDYNTMDFNFEKSARRNGSRGDPFGDETNAEVKYRTMEWWQAAMIMIAETISIGILSLPSTMAAVGMAPGVILIIGLGSVATYTGYTIGQFKAAYPHVHSMADAGEVLLGPVGRELFGFAQVVFLIFIMGSHILTFIIAMDVITDHATCNIAWGAIATVILFLCSVPRTLRKVSYFSIAAFASIVAAVLITMIALGISPPDPHIQTTTVVTFAGGFGAILNIVFAFAGHVAFFSFISELKDPNDYPKALCALQIADTTMYLIVAVVVYRYAGPDVASPALGSTGPIVTRIAYGIALPTILIAGVIYGHVNTKYIYVRMFRGTKHMHTRSLVAIGSWVTIALILWVIAWVIAESIPVFNDLVGFIAALFASWFTYTLSGIFWLYINKGQWFRNWRKIALTIVNVLIIAIGLAVFGIGLWATGTGIAADVHSGKGKSWSCT